MSVMSKMLRRGSEPTTISIPKLSSKYYLIMRSIDQQKQIHLKDISKCSYFTFEKKIL